MLVVLNDNRLGLTVKRVNACHHLGAALLAPRLDRRLAAGTAAESGMLLALRAARLVKPSTRRRLAGCLANVLQQAAKPRRLRPVPICTPPAWNVNAAVDALRALATRLSSPGPVSARGIAKTDILLRDGAGPLYYPSRRGQLAEAVRDAIDAL